MPLTFIIKQNGVEIGRISGERLEHAKKAKSSNLMETVMVDDPDLLKAVDEHGLTLFIIALRQGKGLTVEKS